MAAPARGLRRHLLESLWFTLRESRRRLTPKLPYVFLALGVICLLTGSYLGLFVAPPEHFMGDVQRIMYVHVPTAWNAMPDQAMLRRKAGSLGGLGRLAELSYNGCLSLLFQRYSYA